MSTLSNMTKKELVEEALVNKRLLVRSRIAEQDLKCRLKETENSLRVCKELVEEVLVNKRLLVRSRIAEQDLKCRLKETENSLRVCNDRATVFEGDAIKYQAKYESMKEALRILVIQISDRSD